MFFGLNTWRPLLKRFSRKRASVFFSTCHFSVPNPSFILSFDLLFVCVYTVLFQETPSIRFLFTCWGILQKILNKQNKQTAVSFACKRALLNPPCYQEIFLPLYAPNELQRKLKLCAYIGSFWPTSTPLLAKSSQSTTQFLKAWGATTPAYAPPSPIYF